jgi:hypothetical protein
VGKSLERARLAGFSGLRIVVLHDSADISQCAATHGLSDSNEAVPVPIASLCLFDRQNLDEEAVRGLLRHHPLAIVNGKMCRNPLGRHRAAGFPIPLDWMMETILANEESREFLEAQNGVLIQEAARLGKTGEEFHQQIETLNRALESRDRLLITIARWLSRPLPALCAHLDDFMDDERLLPIHDEFESCSDHIAAIRRLSSGLDEIAGFLQMQVVLRPEPLDLVTIARQAVVDVRDEDGGADFEVEFVGASKVEGTWDRLRLARLFQSLVRTSRDQGYGGKVLLGITDMKNLARVQVEFHQPLASAETASTSSHESAERYRRPVDESDYERLGVALWPSRELARVMGGTLGVSTWADARVVFTIDLPKLCPTSRRDGKASTREAGYQ